MTIAEFRVQRALGLVTIMLGIDIVSGDYYAMLYPSKLKFTQVPEHIYMEAYCNFDKNTIGIYSPELTAALCDWIESKLIKKER